MSTVTHLLHDPAFWITVCALGIIGCVVYVTKGWGNGAHHAGTEPEPGRPLDRSALLEDAPPALPDDGRDYEGDPFAHLDAGQPPDPDGSVWAGLLARDPDDDYPPLPVEAHHEPVTLAAPPVLPMVPVLPVMTGRPVPPEDGGDDETEHRYREQVAALLRIMPVLDSPAEPDPLPPVPAARESGTAWAEITPVPPRRWTPPDGAGLAALRDALLAWNPDEAAPEPEPVTEDQPPSAGDETREIWLGMARQMNWLTPAEQVALWDQEFCKPITVGTPQHAAEDGAQ